MGERYNLSSADSLLGQEMVSKRSKNSFDGVVFFNILIGAAVMTQWKSVKMQVRIQLETRFSVLTSNLSILVPSDVNTSSDGSTFLRQKLGCFG